MSTTTPSPAPAAGSTHVTVARGELLTAAERHDVIQTAKTAWPAELSSVSADTLAQLLLLAEHTILVGQPSTDSLEARTVLTLMNAVRDIFSPTRRSNGNVLLIEEYKERAIREAIDAVLLGKQLPEWDPATRELIRVLKAILRSKDRTGYGSRIVSAKLEQELTTAFANVRGATAKAA